MTCHPCSSSVPAGAVNDAVHTPSQLQIILLDFGLAEELTPRVRRHFISFLNMSAKGELLNALL